MGSLIPNVEDQRPELEDDLIDDDFDVAMEPRSRGLRAVGLYWGLLALALVALVAAGAVGTPGTFEALFVIVLALPAIQLGVSLLAGIALLAFGNPARSRTNLRRLAWITAASLLGAIAGAGLMLVVFF